jgi:hypothetical protein
VHLIKTTLHACHLYQQDPGCGIFPERDFIIVALDLISGVVQALKSNSEHMLQTTDPPVIQLVLHCLNVNVSESCVALYSTLFRMKARKSDKVLMHF